MMANGGPDGSAPPRRLYGRSRGKALRAGQERRLAEALPLFSIAPEALAAGRAFAARPREVWLEIGFGAGEHLIEQAKANPDVGVVGCEPFLNGVAAALAGLEREHLSNVRLRRGDAQALVEAAPDGFFSRVFILYPDPWPKRRHHKRRVVGVGMIEALARHARGGRVALRHRHRRLRRLDAQALSRFAPFPLDREPSRRLAAALARMAPHTIRGQGAQGGPGVRLPHFRASVSQ
jgi:tRNA G46 methylase TrmB